MSAHRPTRLALTSFAVGCLVAGLTGCRSGGPDMAGARPANIAADSWIANRSRQLEQSGLKSADADAKARQEWSARSLGSPSEQAYTIYDSTAKAKAEQQKLNEGLEKMQRGP